MIVVATGARRGEACIAASRWKIRFHGLPCGRIIMGWRRFNAVAQVRFENTNHLLCDHMKEKSISYTIGTQIGI